MDEQNRKRAVLIKSLKLLLGLSKVPHDGESETEELLEWFEETKAECKADDESGFKFYGHLKGYYLVIPQLMAMLKECLLSHRWQQCLEVILVLADELSNTLPTGSAVFHGGMEVFYQAGGDSSNHLDQFITQLKLLSEINAQTVVLEYIMYLLAEGRADDAKMQVELITKRYKLSSSHDKLVNKSLVKAYEGLVYYVEYLEAKHRRRSWFAQSQGDPLLESTFSASSESQIMTSAANKAINCFRKIEGQEGVWEIFVAKHAELLEYVEQSDAASLVLRQHAEKNPDNPNAWKLLFNFYCRHEATADTRIKVLSTICALVPSDAAVLQLHAVLGEQDAPLRARLSLLFDMLDYAVWKDDVRPWRQLAGDLRTACADTGDARATRSEHVQDLWAVRATWWPEYHFDAFECNTDDMRAVVRQQPALITAKVEASNLLLGHGNTYAREIDSILKT